MLRDISESQTHAAEPGWLGILAARDQVEAARARRAGLIASGRLPDFPGNQRLPDVALPGYRLVREIHRGGQGVVFEAVQESTRRKVAIKVMLGGPFSGAADRARFEREIQILAQLKHPHIVTIHDSGDADSATGCFYYVMDYVEGRPLDEFARNAPAAQPLRETLELFAKICDAVNAAHLRGVIHRDLKPRNILIDDHAEPRVLDFGLAKFEPTRRRATMSAQIPDMDASSHARALDPLRDDRPGATDPYTRTGQFLGSLPWASPEQAAADTDRIDIRTDVYSLGVVLYQLLTGRFPYDLSGSMQETLDRIQHAEPIRPARAAGVPIPYDVETITLRCLAKERERRYQSAGELARDIRCYLAGEPIEARRDSAAYVTMRLIARHRVIVSAACLVLIAVVGGLVVSLAAWRQAEQERTAAQQSAVEAREAAARADRDADRARAVTAFLGDVLTSVQPENRGADVRLIDLLTDASRVAAQRFAGHPEQEGQVRWLLGRSFHQLSLWSESCAELGRAWELLRNSAGPDDPRTLEAASDYLSAVVNLERVDEVEAVIFDLLPRLERVFGPNARQTLSGRRIVAISHLFRGRLDEAERILVALRERPEAASEAGLQTQLLAALVAVQYRRLSEADPAENRPILQRIEQLTREWIEHAGRATGPDSINTLLAQLKHTDAISELGRPAEAAAACREILNRPIERLGECHKIRTDAMYILAESLTRLGEHAEPAELMLAHVRCFRERFDAGSPLLLAGISDTLKYVERAGRAADGEPLARELSKSLAALGGGHGDMSFQSDLFIAHFVSMQGRLQEAEPLFEALFPRQAGLTDRWARARLHLYYGDHLIRARRFDDAEKQLHAAAAVTGDVSVGTWDSHPDDIIRAFVRLYEASQQPELRNRYSEMLAPQR